MQQVGLFSNANGFSSSYSKIFTDMYINKILPYYLVSLSISKKLISKDMI